MIHPTEDTLKTRTPIEEIKYRLAFLNSPKGKLISVDERRQYGREMNYLVKKVITNDPLEQALINLMLKMFDEIESLTKDVRDECDKIMDGAMNGIKVSTEKLKSIVNPDYSSYSPNEVLTEDGITNLVIVAKFETPLSAARALKTMSEGGLLKKNVAQRNRDALFSIHEDCLCLVSGEGQSGAGYLKTKDLMTGEKAQANFDALVAHSNQESLGAAFIVLSHGEFYRGDLTQDYFDILMRSPDPSKAAFALLDNRLLRSSNPFLHANFVAVMSHTHPESLAKILGSLIYSDLLTGNQASRNRDALARYSTILFETREAKQCWDRIPSYRLTQDNFNAIIQICEQNQDNPAAGIVAYMAFVDERLLGRRVNEIISSTNTQGELFSSTVDPAIVPVDDHIISDDNDDRRIIDNIKKAANKYLRWMESEEVGIRVTNGIAQWRIRYNHFFMARMAIIVSKVYWIKLSQQIFHMKIKFQKL
ncbi:MAG: hypothetical protein P1U74_07750 [Legionellaceae bacterium]|nr:hypothetical protein [Legionellaceae bacterium]